MNTSFFDYDPEVRTMSRRVEEIVFNQNDFRPIPLDRCNITIPKDFRVSPITLDYDKYQFNSIIQEQTSTYLNKLNDIDASTDLTENIAPDFHLDVLFARCFREAQNIQFEDGYENDFSTTIIQLFYMYGNRLFDKILDTISNKSVNTKIINELLKTIGRIEQPSTHKLRKWILVKSLLIVHNFVKDGAILGLSFLDDPQSIPSILNAIKVEKNEFIVEDLIQLHHQLK